MLAWGFSHSPPHSPQLAVRCTKVLLTGAGKTMKIRAFVLEGAEKNLSLTWRNAIAPGFARNSSHLSSEQRSAVPQRVDTENLNRANTKL